ncbi:AAA family ATPase [Caldichromatium japonicum]|uniref:AAA family ATPase n=1 Tax=Caldichromatium japonicum TaxID=2699430 RepID=A0A6G7VCT9_9GAMM|nr:bifunctional aminoglycoside phosphotransferase/ATP-binding protein [Caldichromatium japonicum]QIK37784.1 AAA family ATPase [Caldichromatium japonicum]
MQEEDLVYLSAALQHPAAYPHPTPDIQHLETHISHIFLAGDYAYKLKKPLNLGFLDFSTLEQRKYCCEEEVRLNRRLAPDLYLGVVTINGSLKAPRIGGAGPILEYAVQMRRFPQTALLDRQTLTPELINRLAELIADFHLILPPAAPQSGFGSPERVLSPMLENLAQLRARLDLPEVRAAVDELDQWTRKRFVTLRPIIETRRIEGFVREGHGDLHRGNIALVDQQIYIFDAIEFNPNLRWIDTASDIAFFVMDLEQAGEFAAARRFLNRYLERTGDYGALLVLDFYKVYRALVRAKVVAIRVGQDDLTSESAATARRDLWRYLELALSYQPRRPRRPRLLIACGLPGSGKSRLSLQLREVWPLIHLRSDIERKRLFGLHEQARTVSALNGGIYFPKATEWTYERLHRLADLILSSGYDVLVDATFIIQARRRRFAELARRHGAGFAILALEAPLEVLRERIKCRLAREGDPSEADLQVLERQHASCEPLSTSERTQALMIDTSRTPPFTEILTRLTYLIEQRHDSGSSFQGAPQEPVSSSPLTPG